MRHLSVAGAVLLVYTACSSSAAVPVEESVPSTRGSAARDNGSQAPIRPQPPGASAPASGQPLPGWQGGGQSVPDYGAPLGRAAAGGTAGVAAAAGGAAAGAAGAGGLGELFYKIQVLEQEVQDLRGLVEEQRHQLERLARDQQEQYLDLDRRMQALRNSGGGANRSSGSGSGGAERTPQRAGNGSAAAAANAGAANGGEREAYADAFNLMKERQFDASAAAFNELVENYPNGTYTANAYYWLGELHLAQDQNESARQSFAQVINLYPDHQKVADALYKLGVVYHRLGDLERARQYLEQVRSEHPDTSAAGLAQTYLAELQ